MSYHLPHAPCLSFPIPLTSRGMNFAFIPPLPDQKPQWSAVISPAALTGSSSLGVPQRRYLNLP